MTEIIDAPGAQTALSAPLQDLARQYVAARAKTGEGVLEMARCVAAARDAAAHGEWRLWLDGTGTTADTAERLVNIHRQAERDPGFRAAVGRNWLGQTAAALLAAPSTPDAVRAEVLAPIVNAPPEAPPPPAPSSRQIAEKVQAARPAPANSAALRSSESGRVPAAPVTLTPATPAPPPAQIEMIPATPREPVRLTPLIPEAPAAPAAGVEVIAAAGVDPVKLKDAEALIALLEQAVALAYVERDRIRHELGGNVRFRLPDEAVEAAARAFLNSPTVRSAASFLGMSAREE